MLDVLVVGSGGREYELARQMSLSQQVGQLYVGPGNAGTGVLEKAKNVDLSPTDVDGICDFVRQNNVGVVIIGPDASVNAGLADALRAENVPVFGPGKKAAQLEGSKSFAAQFMERHEIPQPQCWVAHTEQAAFKIIKHKSPHDYVLKADGLAAGKGVVLPSTKEEAEKTLVDMFAGVAFDGAGKDAVVIQERLHGPEVSAFVISDGENFVMLPFAQDHKRLKDNDEGPNTGGMGAYCPVPEKIVSQAQAEKIYEIAARTIEGMASEGTPYQGVLYIGLMLAKEHGGDPVVIEYNARFGDPETQVVLPALSQDDINVADMLIQAAKGDISGLPHQTSVPSTALTVALAAAGYPETPRKGDVIYGLNQPYENVIIHHAGTKLRGEEFVTNGGRVLYVTGIGDNAAQAAKRAYAAIGMGAIHFEGMQYRKDIGHQAR